MSSLDKSASNAQSHSTMVQNLILEAENELRNHAQNIQSLKQETKLFKERIQGKIFQIQRTLQPSMALIKEQLNSQMAAQKQENSSLQAQLIELKREKSVIQQFINGCVARTQVLEQEVGKY